MIEYMLHITVDEADVPGYAAVSIGHDRYYGGNIIRATLPPADVRAFIVDNIGTALALSEMKAQVAADEDARLAAEAAAAESAES